MIRKSIFLLIAGIFLFLVPEAGCVDTERTTPVGETVRFAPPRATRNVLPNGLVFYVLEDHELPLFHLSAVVRTGSAYDPEGKEGLAELTGTVMRTGGTAFHSGDEINELLDFLAASLEVSTSMESTAIDVSVLAKDIDQGIQIFSEMLMNPLFAEDKLTLARNLKIEEVIRLQDDPMKLAFREFTRLMYRGNPRGRKTSAASLANIQREDLVRFHRRFWNSENIMIVISGDIKTDEAVSKIRKYLGEWRGDSGKSAPLPSPERQKGGIFYLPKDIPQSIIIYGQSAPAHRDENYYPFTVLDFILGSGGFQSSIFQEIRNSRGLAYSAGSFYRAKSDHGLFAAYAMTKSSSTNEVLSLVRSIVEGGGDSSPNDSTVAWARRSIMNRFIFSYLSSIQIARQEMMIEYEGLPDDYLVKYNEKIGKVRLEDIQRESAAYFIPDEAVILVVGNRKVFDQLPTAFGEVNEIIDSSK